MKLSADRTTRPRKKSIRGDPPWEIALLFPAQGEWTEHQFLALDSSGTGRMMELVDGFLEVLPMPDVFHQRILKLLFRLLDDFVSTACLGEVLFAPLPVRLWERQMREPDIVFLKSNRVKDPHKAPEGADLALEIVSPGEENRERDLKDKR